ncbi:DMT family transporter [Celeribacter indicus]|uniref:Small multidrug resistance protein n=1 Tax=Celeribacter indicus TaxID=1208324 RepID=A0A0B5DV73_9RHOB|nr:multidrug efflux SMR transporter [Celeribacter indicus]AJE46919.1 small multidrug resistance protein [Celeribacter indicus]SDW78631.1 small multidrug resistance pump [Celeribacter indicus]
MPKHYLFLLAAIVSEVIGTSALNASQQFTRPLPTLVVAIGYGLSFYLLTHVLKVMPVGVVYAIWSGLGVVLITLAGLVLFAQKIDLPAALGMAMIVGGVIVIHLFSGTTSH